VTGEAENYTVWSFLNFTLQQTHNDWSRSRREVTGDGVWRKEMTN